MLLTSAAQWIVLAFALLIAFVGSDRTRLFAVTVAATMDMFGMALAGPNVPFYRAVIIILIPSIVFRDYLCVVRSSRPVRLLTIYTVYMVLLGVWFGFIAPWPDITGERPWNQQAAGRALISSTRHIVDLLCLIFIARRASDQEGQRTFITAVLAGVVANCLIASADVFIPGRLADWISSVTFEDMGRQGGLNIEPRGMGRVAAYAIVIFLGTTMLRKGERALGVLAGLVCAVLAVSTSALLSLSAGLVVMLLVSLTLKQFTVAQRAAVVALVALAVGVPMTSTADSDINRRVENISAPEDSEFGESPLVARLEVFDRAAAKFFAASPKYLLFGVGPDLVSLPASDYISSSARTTYVDRIDSTPHMGLVLLTSNGGMIGLLMWVAIITSLVRVDVKNAHITLAVAAIAALTWSPLVYFWLAISAGSALQASEGSSRQTSKVPMVRNSVAFSAGRMRW